MRRFQFYVLLVSLLFAFVPRVAMSDGGFADTISSISSSIYHPDRIYLKVRYMPSITKSQDVYLDASLMGLLDSYGAVRVMSPYARHYESFGGRFQSSSTGVERICRVYFADSVSLDAICADLNRLDAVEYAERVPIDYLFAYTPNDQRLGEQWHHDNIKMKEA